MKDIKVSPQHGLNPAVPVCFFCQKEKNEIILAGRLPGDVEAPKNVAWDKEPCDTCKGLMKQGVILISVDEDKSNGDMDNPYRSGAWIVVTEEYIRRWPDENLVASILEKRVCFISDRVWDLFKLPREAVPGVPSTT